MLWKTDSPADERLKFIIELLNGESMARLCREFGVSRKTGYKILKRYQTEGLVGLQDRSRRPNRTANQLPSRVEYLVIQIKLHRPNLGASCIRAEFINLYPTLRPPARSTIQAVLTRHGLLKRR